jgi:predicted metalloendopeptidase
MTLRALLPLSLALVACPKPDTTSTAPAPVDPLSVAGISASVESALDRSVDPCVDFYQFACGGWEAKTEIPSDRPRVSRGFTDVYEKNQSIVRSVLDDAAAGKIEADDRLGAYFGGCMDSEAIDARGAAPLKAALGEIGMVKDGASLAKILGTFPQMDAFFSGGIEADFSNPDVNIMHVSQGGLGLPERSYYLPDDDEGNKLLKDYVQHIRTMFGFFGLDPNDADKVLAIETRLAKVSRAPAELRNVEALNNKIDREGLQELIPSLPLDVMFTALGNADIQDINVMTPEFFPEVEAIVTDDKWVPIRAYLSWSLIRAMAPYLSSEIDQTNFSFYGTRLNGQQEQQVRWKRCVSRTDGDLGDLLGQAYVDRAFAGESKAKALAMIRAIQTSFQDGLPELDWMDDETRTKAVEKLGTISNKIGYPDTWETYEGLEITGSHFEDVMAVQRWNMAKEFAKVGQPVDKTQWYMTPPTVNAYYNPLVNEIVFPAGILQPPFFSQRYPTAMNYGAMGMIMGHEVTHGFDDEGRKFAPDGSLKEWWAPEASEAFEERAACVTELYDGYEALPGVFVNGELTLGENIADLGGLSLAARAYDTWKAAGNSDPEIAGFTGDQMLYLAYAQGWCTKATPEFIQRRVDTDPHSPPRFRVNGAVSQTPAFGEAFSCDPGTPMRPTDVCEVW